MPPATTPRRVFVVEDHPVMREVLTAFVRSQPGLEVGGEAASGEEALEALIGAPCDLALVDVQMPGMDGITLVGRLHDSLPAMPCIVVSAQPDTIYADKARAAGAHNFVPKGDPVALLDAIHAALA